MTKSLNLKNLGALLLAVICLISLLPFSHATEKSHEGMISESAVSWNLDDNGMLTISGRGSCLAFSSKDDQPWADHRLEIRSVVFDPSAYLANLDISYWFDGCENLAYATLVDAIRVIGTSAFANCPSLGELSISSDRKDFEIQSNAFYLSGNGHLEVRLNNVSNAVFTAFTLYDFAADHRSVCIDNMNAPSVSVLAANTPATRDGGTRASGYCISCDGTYSYSLGYSDMGDSCHAIRHWCSNCGMDQCGGVNIEDHTYGSNGICTKCGHNNGSGGGGDDPDPPYVCYHPSTSTTWRGCYWYEYCNICDELVDSGASHNYSYGNWTYYNTTRHKRTGTCTRCGETTTGYGNHTTTTKYDPYNATQHEKYSYCSVCNSRIGIATKENHTFTYGSWQSYNEIQHRRTKTCSKCGYQEYEYENHSKTYGNWTNDTTNATRHKRTVSCSCGYSATEYEDHSYEVDSIVSVSDTQHKSTMQCSVCGKQKTETQNHTFTYSEWESVDGTQQRRRRTCSDCGYSDYEYSEHAFTYGPWESVSETQHRRSRTCACGYSDYEYAEHSFLIGNWENYGDEQKHRRKISCACGYEAYEYADHRDDDSDGFCDDCGKSMTVRFSVTVPASLSIIISPYGDITTATNARIVNHSAGAVRVTSLSVSGEDGWYLVDYAHNMANEKVDCKKIGFKVNGAETNLIDTDNTAHFDLTGNSNWRIGVESELPLAYDAVVSATSQPITDEQVLTLCFVVGWAA